MAARQHNSPEREARVDEWRRAWFDGWAEGVIWTLARTVHALRESGHPECVGWSVIQRMASDTTAPEAEASRKTR